MIELGAIKIHPSDGQDDISLAAGLVRLLSNQEIAEMLGVSERTVRRWKRDGRLPDRGKERLLLADVVGHLIGGAA